MRRDWKGKSTAGGGEGKSSMVKSFCEKCFKDVEVGPDSKCSGCGADLSEKSKIAAIESSRTSGIELPWGKGLIAGGALLVLIFIGVWLRHKGPSEMYPGDELRAETCGSCNGTGKSEEFGGDRCLVCESTGKCYTFVYGPNHPGEVTGMVLDPDKLAAILAVQAQAQGQEQGQETGGGVTVPDYDARQMAEVSEELSAKSGGPGAYMAYLKKKRQEGEAREAVEAAVRRQYGVPGAKVRLLRKPDRMTIDVAADDTGRFKVKIPPGQWMVTATHPDYADYAAEEAVELTFEKDYERVQVGSVSRADLIPNLSFRVEMRRR